MPKAARGGTRVSARKFSKAGQVFKILLKYVLTDTCSPMKVPPGENSAWGFLYARDGLMVELLSLWFGPESWLGSHALMISVSACGAAAAYSVTKRLFD